MAGAVAPEDASVVSRRLSVHAGAQCALTPDARSVAATPEDASHILARAVSHHAGAHAGVLPVHGGKPVGGGCAEDANLALTPDTMASFVNAYDASRSLARPLSKHTVALAVVLPDHTGRPGLWGGAEDAKCALPPDTLAGAVTPEDASHSLALRVSHHAGAQAGVLPVHGGKPVGGGCAEDANLALTPDTMSAGRHAMDADTDADASPKNSTKLIAAWADTIE
jgi:hypothetical protein